MCKLKYFQVLSECKMSALLEIVKPVNSCQLPKYLYLQSCEVVKLFFKFRLDMFQLNYNIISRHNLNIDHSCMFCDELFETRSHVLLYCVHYSQFRNDLCNTLSSLFDILPIVPPYEVLQYSSWDGSVS